MPEKNPLLNVVSEGLKETLAAISKYQEISVDPNDLSEKIYKAKQGIETYSKDNDKKLNNPQMEMISSIKALDDTLKFEEKRTSTRDGQNIQLKEMQEISAAALKVAEYGTGNNTKEMVTELKDKVKAFEKKYPIEKAVNIEKTQDKVKIDSSLAKVAHGLGAPYRALKKKVETQLVKRGIKEPNDRKAPRNRNSQGPTI